MAMFCFSSGSMEEGASPSPASSGGGAGGGRLDVMSSATKSPVVSSEVMSLLDDLEVEDPAGRPASLRVVVFVKGRTGR